jgi:cytochrome b
MSEASKSIRVWDLPTRVFHWSLLLAFVAVYLTGDVLDLLEPHQWFGLAMVGLLVFRLVWGVIGSTTARFSQFVRGKAAVSDYLNGRWQGVGHNPLGGWSVMAMLALLFAMVITGLFANNDADFAAPLTFLVSDGVSSLLTSAHHLLFKLLLVVVAVHIGAIFFYKIVLAKDLVTPMLKGDAPAESDNDASTQGGGMIAVMVALVIAVLAVWGASGAWYQPPAKPAVSTPEW